MNDNTTTLGRSYTGNPKAVSLDVYRYLLENGEETGLVRRTKGRQASDVVADLEYELRDLVADCEGTHLGSAFRPEYPTCFKFAEVPRYTRVIAYAVTGGNEGHYAYVELILPDDSRDTLWTAKTFLGADHAWAIARRAADLLEV